MADEQKQSPQPPQRRDVKDPTVRSDSQSAEYPEGTHPARSASEVTHAAKNIKYRDAADKPDPSSVAQEADIPPEFPGQDRSGS